jgi:hypothetical protein
MCAQSQEAKLPVKLSLCQVEGRLQLCEEPEIVDELYDFGQGLLKDINERIRGLESKAISFAAYGAAIITLLISSSAIWLKLGNDHSALISVCGGICGFECTYFSIRVLLLREFERYSDEDWLKTEFLTNIYDLKRYRILTFWYILQSHKSNHAEKVRNMASAQVWLTGAVIFLLYLLLQIAFVSVKNPIGNWVRENLAASASIGGGLWSGLWLLLLGLTLILVYRRSRAA